MKRWAQCPTQSKCGLNRITEDGSVHHSTIGSLELWFCWGFVKGQDTMHVNGINHLFVKSVSLCVCVYLQFTKGENEALSHPCAFRSAAGAGLRKRRREGWEEWGERKGGGEWRREEGRHSGAWRGSSIGIGLLARWRQEQKVSSSSVRGGHHHPLFWGSWLVRLHGTVSFSQPSDVFRPVEHFLPWSHFSSFSWKTMRS